MTRLYPSIVKSLAPRQGRQGMQHCREICLVFLRPWQWIPNYDWVAVGSQIITIQCKVTKCISTPVQSLDLSRATNGVTWFLSSLASWENITSWSGMFTPANKTCTNLNILSFPIFRFCNLDHTWDKYKFSCTPKSSSRNYNWSHSQ